MKNITYKLIDPNYNTCQFYLDGQYIGELDGNGGGYIAVNGQWSEEIQQACKDILDRDGLLWS